jgi:tryptophan synthase alpha chain
MQSLVADTLPGMVARIRTHTDLPIAVGFGISTAEQGRTVARTADAVVVGSAIVNQIAAAGKPGDLVPRVSNFVKTLLAGVKNS